MIDINNLKTGTYKVKEKPCELKPLEPTIEEVTALAWELNNEKIQTRMWKEVAEKLAEYLEWYAADTRWTKKEEWLEAARKERGYEPRPER